MDAKENEGMGIAQTKNLMYVPAYQEHLMESEFNVQNLGGFFITVSFTRFIVALMLTETLGPIISTIFYMIRDIAAFLTIWVLIVGMFACASLLAFQDIENFSTVPNAFIYYFECAFGGWDLSVFDMYLDVQPEPRVFMRYFGIVTVLFYVTLQLILLVNVVIAIMTDTYAAMTSVRKGVYNYNVLRAVATYMPTKYYGGLGVLPSPANFLIFCFSPLFIFIKDKKRLERINGVVYTCIYTLWTMIISIFFIPFNLILLPFAYFKTCILKINLARKKRIPAQNCLSYILLGLPILLFAQLTDYWAFAKAMNIRRKPTSSNELTVINTQQFKAFAKIVD